jgi:hypothetical protein
MSLQDIAIVRRFPVINGFVIIPDYGPDKIALADALLIPGVRLNSLFGNVEMFLETLPGVVSCCDNAPADSINETVKRVVVPGYPDGDPNDGDRFCDCPFDVDAFNQIVMTVSFLNSRGSPVVIDREACGCSNSFTGDELIILSAMVRGEEEGYPRCTWVGYSKLDDFRIIISYTGDCRWVITLYCLVDRQFVAIWQGYSDSSLPYGSYDTLVDGSVWCAPIYSAYVSPYQPN